MLAGYVMGTWLGVCWVVAGYVLGAGWMCARCYLGLCWVLARWLGTWLGVCWVLARCVLDVAWVCAGCWLGVCWVLPGCVLGAGLACAGCWLLLGAEGEAGGSSVLLPVGSSRVVGVAQVHTGGGCAEASEYSGRANGRLPGPGQRLRGCVHRVTQERSAQVSVEVGADPGGSAESA